MTLVIFFNMTKTIYISHRSKLDLKKTRAAIQTVFLGLKERYDIDGQWKSDKLLTISGPSVSGLVDISDLNDVTISVSLGAMLTPFSMLIKNQIREEFSRVFA